jgi:hypothetical protein
MSSSIYEEALADVKKLKEVAEQNAKNAIIDAVTPKIREMIEKQLIGDAAEESEQGDILADLAESLLGADADDITLTSESLKALSGLVNNAGEGFSSKDAELTSLLVQERLLVVMDNVTAAGPDINELAEMKQEIFKTYQYLVENKSVINDDDFNRIQKRLASLDYFLTEAIGENEMNERDLHSILDEATLSLVLDLGDDVELDADAVTVNVVQPDEDEVAEEDIDTAEESEVSDDDEVMASELGDVEDLTRTADDDSVATAGDGIAESDDDDMLEINEEQLASMIRSILNEDDDADDADEQDNMDELDSDSTDEDSYVSDETNAPVVMESDGLTDDTVVEISETMLRDELMRMRHLRESTDETITTDESVEITESNIDSDPTDEVTQLKTQLQEYEKAVSSLRNQLDESNLFNAKLLYANKLLQNRDLNDRQRVNIVESLDNAKSLREVRLLYKSLVDSTNTKSNLTESKRRRAAGSASRPTRTGSVSKESYPETDRWALLAGLNK